MKNRRESNPIFDLHKVDAFLRRVENESDEQALVQALNVAPNHSMIFGKTISQSRSRIQQNSPKHSLGSHPSNFSSQLRSNTPRSGGAPSKVHVAKLKERITSLQSSYQHPPQRSVSEKVGTQVNEEESRKIASTDYSIHTVESLPPYVNFNFNMSTSEGDESHHQQLEKTLYEDKMRQVARGIYAFHQGDDRLQSFVDGNNNNSLRSMPRVIDTGTPRSTAQLYHSSQSVDKNRDTATIVDRPVASAQAPSTNDNSEQHGDFLPTDQFYDVAAEEAKKDVQGTDEEIRRTFGLPHGKGANPHQVDALVAALASAMVLLKRYE